MAEGRAPTTSTTRSYRQLSTSWGASARATTTTLGSVLCRWACSASGASGTYPHTAWFPSQATQNRIFDAYLQAFPTTLLMQRYPSVGGTSVRPRLGLFDDSFAYSTVSDKQSLNWYFWPRVLAAGQRDFGGRAPWEAS